MRENMLVILFIPKECLVEVSWVRKRILQVYGVSLG